MDPRPRPMHRSLIAMALMLGCGCASKTEPAEEPKAAPSAVSAEPTAAPAPDVAQQYEAFVSERNSCTAVSECVLVSPGCPLGCGTGVRAEFATEVESKAKELIAERESRDGACTYKCAAMHVECSEGRCTAVSELATP